MKFFIAFAVCVAVAVAAPQNPADVQAQVINESSDITPEGNYNHALQTSNGIDIQAQGQLKQNTLAKSAEDPAAFIVASGRYSFVGGDGVTYTVTWVADENGFQPQGAHLPVAPAVPGA